MFGTLLKRWRSASVESTATDSTSAGDANPSPETLRAPGPEIPCWRLVRRRPLLGATGAIAGWDLELPPDQAARIARPGSPRSVRVAHQNALLHAARSVVQSEQVPLMAPPAAAIVDTEFLTALPRRTILRLGAEHETVFGRHIASVVESLARQGVQVATANSLHGTIGLLDGSRHSDRDALIGAAEELLPVRSSRIAINVFSFEDVAALIEMGFTYCCGAFQRQTRRAGRNQLSGPVVGAAAALAAVVAARPLKEIVTLVKSDVTLSYRLLRVVNSAAFGLTRPAESIQDALLLLGSRELYRWLTVLLVSAESERPLAAALYETALTRARLCELLAIERRSEPPEALFVLGAFSLLDVLLDVPIEVPLATARLPDAAVEALISASGPWRPHLDAALAIESADPATFEHAAERLALAPDRLSQLADEAADWAHQAAATINAGNRPKNPRAPQHASCQAG